MYHCIKEMATIKLPFSIKFQIIIEVDKLLIVHSLECPRVRLLDFRLVFHIVVVFSFNLFPLPDGLSQDTKGDRMLFIHVHDNDQVELRPPRCITFEVPCTSDDRIGVSESFYRKDNALIQSSKLAHFLIHCYS